MSQARTDLRDFSDTGAIVFVGYYHQASQFVREISAARPSLPIILTDGAKDDKLFERLGPVPKDLYITFVAPDWHRPESYATSLKGQSALSSYLSWLNIQGSAADPGFGPIAVDAINLIYSIVERKGTSSNTGKQLRSVVRTALKDKTLTHQGVFRQYKFTEKGEVSEGRAYLFHVTTNGKGSRGFYQLDPDSLQEKRGIKP